MNTEKIEAQAAQARAALLSAEAKRLQSQATFKEAQAELARLEHVRELSGGRVPSRQEFDSQEATVKRAEAEEAVSAAQVTQSRASLAAIETDIRKAVIRSPIDGIVLDRQVDPGQTVAASFQTPTLFTLAEDLTRMKLIIDVDEADIGTVRVGQRAIFRVDAYPDRMFESKVKEVRSTPKTSNGVVTYQTVLSVDNSERLLQPGMTATAEITVTQVQRRDPRAQRGAPVHAAGGHADQWWWFPVPSASPWFATPRPFCRERCEARLDARTANSSRPLRSRLGASDGTVTELRGGQLAPGTPVIVDLATN